MTSIRWAYAGVIAMILAAVTITTTTAIAADEGPPTASFVEPRDYVTGDTDTLIYESAPDEAGFLAEMQLRSSEPIGDADLLSAGYASCGAIESTGSVAAMMEELSEQDANLWAAEGLTEVAVEYLCPEFADSWLEYELSD
jgi:hypothetical protein